LALALTEIKKSQVKHDYTDIAGILSLKKAKDTLINFKNIINNIQ